jgi:hypothetical protein
MRLLKLEFADGGPNAPFQEAAIPMLEPELVKKEMTALQRHFKVRILTKKSRGTTY